MLCMGETRYLVPFQMACDTKSPKITRTALDSLQKLMAYGHIHGRMRVKGPDGQSLILVNQVVDTICRSFVQEATDDNVQLQIIKALLTAVTSKSCEVHEGHLLKARAPPPDRPLP
jgi:brefeldin A-inhibited guanine nucleotide-exchange protein